MVRLSDWATDTLTELRPRKDNRAYLTVTLLLLRHLRYLLIHILQILRIKKAECKVCPEGGVPLLCKHQEKGLNECDPLVPCSKISAALISYTSIKLRTVTWQQW